MSEISSIAQNSSVPEYPAIEGINIAQLTVQHGNNYGTSGYGIMNNVPDLAKTNTLAMMGWMRNCENSNVDPTNLLLQGVDYIKVGYADYNSFCHLFGRYDAEWFIYLGKVLVKQKELVRKIGKIWGVWAAENLPFIGKRTRERMMNLARRKDCHRYPILGTERLDILCSATKGMKGDDPIGAFMAKHGIQFDPTREFDLDEFKLEVDVALANEKLIKNGIEVDHEKVKALTLTGRDLDKSFIQKMKDIRESGGDLNTFLDKVAMTGGGEPEESDGKRLQDFNTLANRLIATIDYLSKDSEEDIDKVSAETFYTLLKKLAKLEKLASFKKLTEAA